MNTIGKLFAILLLSLSAVSLKGQTRLFIVGNAVPGGVQELTVFPNSQFKFAGALKEGTFRIATQADVKLSSTQYLKPSYEDAYIVNHGIGYTTTRDSSAANWIVPFSEDMFRFTVNTSTRTVTGELFCPWNELFIMGGATACGWTTYTFLPFTRLENEICTWEWTGELKYRPENNEPRRFKFSGQNAWEPKMLHPFTADEDVLKSSKLITNGAADNKWSVVKDGIYHIVIDVFRETILAEMVTSESTPDGETLVEKSPAAITIAHRENVVQVACPSGDIVEVFNAEGRSVYKRRESQHTIYLPTHGLYIVKVGEISRKIIF